MEMEQQAFMDVMAKAGSGMLSREDVNALQGQMSLLQWSTVRGAVNDYEAAVQRGFNSDVRSTFVIINQTLTDIIIRLDETKDKIDGLEKRTKEIITNHIAHINEDLESLKGILAKYKN